MYSTRAFCGTRLFAFILTSLILLSTISAQASFYIPGEFKVDDMGAANYTVPLRVLPGTHGMQPDLSLVYNSRNGNGLAGMGMAIGGLSVISRCARTIAQDGVKGGINYDANDRYCMDGARLMAVNGAYGAHGTEYRTELETFNRIISYGGSPATGPIWFEVRTKSGQIMHFGNSADSGIEAQGKSVVRVWAENRVEDTAGNYLTISYLETNANGEYYPRSIHYTGNVAAGVVPFASVYFSYVTRPDITHLYEAGSLIRNTQRLTTIRTYLGTIETPTSLVTEYRLSYEAGNTTGRSRITSITECAVNNVCFKPTILNWQEGWDGTFTRLPSGTIKDDGDGGTAGDLNGDGKTDRVTTIANYYHIDHPSVANKYSFSEGTGIFTDSLSIYGTFFNTGQVLPVLGDFNGDGNMDILGANDGSPNKDHSLYLFNDDNTFTLHTWQSGNNESPAIVADFSGDGRTDFIVNKLIYQMVLAHLTNKIRNMFLASQPISMEMVKQT